MSKLKLVIYAMFIQSITSQVLPSYYQYLVEMFIMMSICTRHGAMTKVSVTPEIKSKKLVIYALCWLSFNKSLLSRSVMAKTHYSYAKGQGQNVVN